MSSGFPACHCHAEYMHQFNQQNVPFLRGYVITSITNAAVGQKDVERKKIV